MGLGDTLPLKLLDSFVQEEVFVGFCHSVEMKNELLSSTGTIKALYTCRPSATYIRPNNIHRNGWYFEIRVLFDREECNIASN